MSINLSKARKIKFSYSVINISPFSTFPETNFLLKFKLTFGYLSVALIKIKVICYCVFVFIPEQLRKLVRFLMKIYTWHGNRVNICDFNSDSFTNLIIKFHSKTFCPLNKLLDCFCYHKEWSWVHQTIHESF